MSNATQTVRINPNKLNQELTQLEVLDKLCDLVGQTDDALEDIKFIGTASTSETEHISVSPGAGETWYINKVDVTCNEDGKFTILKDASTKGSGRTGAAAKNVTFLFTPALKLVTADTLKVKYIQLDDDVSDLEIYVHGVVKT